MRMIFILFFLSTALAQPFKLVKLSEFQPADHGVARGDVLAVALSPSGAQIAVTRSDGTLQLFRTSNGRLEKEVTVAAGDPINSFTPRHDYILEWSADGTLLLAQLEYELPQPGLVKREVHVLHTPTLKSLYRFPETFAGFNLRFALGGRLILKVNDFDLVLLEAQTRQIVGTIPLQPSLLAMSPDGRYLAVASIESVRMPGERYSTREQVRVFDLSQPPIRKQYKPIKTVGTEFISDALFFNKMGNQLRALWQDQVFDLGPTTKADLRSVFVSQKERLIAQIAPLNNPVGEYLSVDSDDAVLITLSQSRRNLYVVYELSNTGTAVISYSPQQYISGLSWSRRGNILAVLLNNHTVLVQRFILDK